MPSGPASLVHAEPSASSGPDTASATAGRRSGRGHDDLPAELSDLGPHLRRELPRLLHWSTWTLRGKLFLLLTGLYAVVTALVIIPNTPLLRFDGYLRGFDLQHRFPDWLLTVKVVEDFGQRWIVTYVLQVLLVYACLRARSIRPMVQLLTGLVLLNCSVGLVKTVIGRIGPMQQADTHKIFVWGGDIYPSGHVSNAVAMFGLLVMAVPRLRRSLTVATVVIVLSVSFVTDYLRTHWFSDVLGGWLAGGLVLLALPSVTPWVERFCLTLIDSFATVLARLPRLDRRVRAGYAAMLRRVPADPGYWAPRPRGSVRDTAAAGRIVDDARPVDPDTAGHPTTVQPRVPEHSLLRPVRELAPLTGVGGLTVAPGPVRHAAATPVSSSASAHSPAAVTSSRAARFGRTRVGAPRNSPGHDGP